MTWILVLHPACETLRSTGEHENDGLKIDSIAAFGGTGLVDTILDWNNGITFRMTEVKLRPNT